MDDLTTQRRRLGGLTPGHAPPGDVGTPAFLGKVITAMPMVGKFFLANPVDIAGDEAEGGGATFTETTGQPVPVYLLGPPEARPGARRGGRPGDSTHDGARRCMISRGRAESDPRVVAPFPRRRSSSDGSC